MKHIKKFDNYKKPDSMQGDINENINFFNKKFIINYKVTNYKVELIDNKYEKILEEWAINS